MEVLHDEQLAACRQLAQAVHVGHDRPVQHAARRRVPPLHMPHATTEQWARILPWPHCGKTRLVKQTPRSPDSIRASFNLNLCNSSTQGFSLNYV